LSEKMFDAVKNALANYQDYLEFEDEPTRIIIKLKKYTPKFGEIRPILEQEFNGEYHKFVDKEHQAFWVIQKGKDAAKPAEEKKPVKPAPAPKKFAPSLPEDTRISCNYFPFAEVYGKECWWYECLPHFLLHHSWNKGWCLADWLYRFPLVSRLWNWWAK